MTEQEMAEHLSTLVGFNPEGGSCENKDLNIEAIDDILEKSFPETITAEMFAEELLGFQARKSEELEKKPMPASEPGRSWPIVAKGEGGTVRERAWIMSVNPNVGDGETFWHYIMLNYANVLLIHN